MEKNDVNKEENESHNDTQLLEKSVDHSQLKLTEEKIK